MVCFKYITVNTVHKGDNKDDDDDDDSDVTMGTSAIWRNSNSDMFLHMNCNILANQR